MNNKVDKTGEENGKAVAWEEAFIHLMKVYFRYLLDYWRNPCALWHLFIMDIKIMNLMWSCSAGRNNANDTDAKPNTNFFIWKFYPGRAKKREYRWCDNYIGEFAKYPQFIFLCDKAILRSLLFLDWPHYSILNLNQISYLVMFAYISFTLGDSFRYSSSFIISSKVR